MVLERKNESLGYRTSGGGNAERRRSRGSCPRSAASRGAGDDIHLIAGPPPDDSQYVQDCRRADLYRVPYCRAGRGDSCVVNLRRSSEVMATRSTGWGMG